MLAKLLEPEVRDLIATRDYATLSDLFEDWLPADLAELVQSLDDQEMVAAFRTIQGEHAAETFAYLDLSTQERLAESLPRETLTSVLNAMSADDRTALLEEVPEDLAARLIALLTSEERAVAELLLDYPDDSVGRLMTPEFLAVRRDWTLRRVLDYIRTHGSRSETLDTIYVIDEHRHLVDDIGIRDLLLAPLDSSVGELMDNQFVALSVADDQETAISVFRKYDRTALPVVDVQGRLLGIVTVDDMLDVAEEENTEDIQKFGGVEALEESYTATPLGQLIRKRATWLTVLFLGEMLTASAMQYFDDVLSKTVLISLFIPLIISSGGNSGSQAATLIIRALALGEVTLRDWWRVMRREIISGLMLGLVLGALGFCRIALWTTFTSEYGPHWVLLGLAVGCSVVGVVLWGTLSGSMLPFLLKRLGLDPATSSAPFVATLVDVTGLIIYFLFALLFLSGTLL